jgi:PhnB protein
MKRIDSYLTFNGNCREAMNFYRDCLGGDLEMQTVGESPLGKMMPGYMKNYILHSSLTMNSMVLLASDMAPSTGIRRGNAISLSLVCENEIEIRECYERLAEGGTREYPLEETFWGALFGGVTDRFENQWLLNYSR